MENNNEDDLCEYAIENLKTRKRILSQKFRIDHGIN
jgi:hypothetical protein